MHAADHDGPGENDMKKNPLLELEKLGQSIWIDFIRRSMTTSGEMRRLIEEDGVSGVTSNPTIFQKAIGESPDYDEAIRGYALEGKTGEEIFEALTVEDIQTVADMLRPTYDLQDGGDGFVSLEVSPLLAHDTSGTIAEARRLWLLVNRPNVMIKVPATREGIPAIRQLIGEGLNINITLLFGLPRYREVAEAYITGLETLAAARKPLQHAASVASFFLSRIDTLTDPLLEEKMKPGDPQEGIASRLHGQTAIASAKVAYQMYRNIFASDRFAALAEKGARTQRLLWASTSTKNPAFRDTKYVEPLIGPDTINTMPVETLDAYRDHGHPQQSLEEGLDEAYQVLDNLPAIGIDLNAVTEQLVREGVEKFSASFEKLMESLKEKQSARVINGGA
jgi:transaldolase